MRQVISHVFDVSSYLIDSGVPAGNIITFAFDPDEDIDLEFWSTDFFVDITERYLN